MKAPLLTRSIVRGIFLVFCFILSGVTAFATHLRAGNIIVKRIGTCDARKYSITVVVYTNTLNTNVLFGGDQDYLDFGDKSPRILIPEIGPGHPNYSVIDAQRGIARAFYTVEWTYGGPGRYTISYVEPNRNEGVLNMDNSVNTTFYIETQIVIDPFLGCSTPADLTIPPIDRACSGKAFFHNPGAFDPDGNDSLSYEMVVPYRDRNATVLNYRAPNDPKFYVDFNTGNETDDGPPTFNINPLDGTITWDAPGFAGEYNIAFIVREWRKVLGRWVAMGYVRRDMQIIVEDDCNNQRPDLEVPEDVCIEAGKTLKETIIGTDPDIPPDKVKLEAVSQIFEFIPSESPATVSPDPAIFQNSPGKLEFEWHTTCEHIREQPYQVVFKVSDSRSNGVSLVTYKTWRIKVVGPAPKWNDATLDISKRQATIKWDPYFCVNAEKMQIWRKVDSTSFRPDTCQTGMPDYLGYTNIATIAAKTASGVQVTQYIDNNEGKGLAPGAMYCYRLVATFPLPDGGESYVSKDTCVGPIPADVPIITNVSVEKTGTTDGQIRVSWKRPFDANKTLYPPPYTYEVYRAIGYTRGTDSTLVTTLSDTTFLDPGLNTEESIYNYSIAAYSPGSSLPIKFVGTSDVASAVRLDTKSQVGQIQLNWTAIVPWSNQIQDHPRHLIYRGPEGSTESELVLIDSIDATIDGLQYTDKGQYNNTPLNEGTTYCYRVKTRGGYGNPAKIPEPLENFSQIICVQPGDSIPPCKPILTVDLLDCEEFKSQQNSCFGSTYSNVLNWSNDAAAECQSDISSYRIYRSATPGGESVFIAEVPAVQTTYSDTNLPSFARCYTIVAVDRSGNESEPSEPVCNDNCPYYELPNVFTPNGDGKNDVFSAFNIRDYLESCSNPEECVIPQNLIEKCARFVEKVKFKVFNRWGQEVYSYESGSENSIFIDWDGKNSSGVELSPAVYYYVAEVTFITLDPGSSTQTFKGWVHLVDGQQ
jgi:hypothetical protein